MEVIPDAGLIYADEEEVIFLEEHLSEKESNIPLLLDQLLPVPGMDKVGLDVPKVKVLLHHGAYHRLTGLSANTLVGNHLGCDGKRMNIGDSLLDLLYDHLFLLLFILFRRQLRLAQWQRRRYHLFLDLLQLSVPGHPWYRTRVQRFQLLHQLQGLLSQLLLLLELPLVTDAILPNLLADLVFCFNLLDDLLNLRQLLVIKSIKDGPLDLVSILLLFH